MECICTKNKKCKKCTENHSKIKEKSIEYSYNWFYHIPCDAYMVNHFAGNFICDKCGKEFFYTKLGLTVEDMKEYYEFWNDPSSSNYNSDKEMIEYFKEVEKEIIN